MIAAEAFILKGSALSRRPSLTQYVDQEAAATLSEEQHAAVLHSLSGSPASVIEGAAGTGKSDSMAVNEGAALRAGRRVHALAPTAKAGRELVGKLQTDTSWTVAKFLRANVDVQPGDVLLVDEAGMIGVIDTANLLKKAEALGASVIFAGDRSQLEAISAGSALRLVAQRYGLSRITEIRRQQVSWQRQASMELFAGKGSVAFNAYADHGCVTWSADKAAALSSIRQDWSTFTATGGTSLVVATRNDDVAQLNAELRQEWRSLNRLQGDDFSVIATPRGRGAKPIEMKIAVGDRINFGRNVEVNGKKIANSDFGTICSLEMTDDGLHMSVELDNGSIASGLYSDFAGRAKSVSMQHGYASTVYSAQGATVDRSFVLHNLGMRADALYVALTRHLHDCQIYVDEGEIKTYLARKGGAS